MIRSALTALAISASLMALSACDQSGNIPATSAETKQAAIGGVSKTDLAEKTSENTYVAKRYGMTATAPDGWYIMDSDITQKLMDVGKALTTADMEAQQKTAMEMSISRTTNIFGFMKFEPGAPRQDGASVMAMAEDISVAPGVKRGSDYFFHLKNVFKQTAADMEIADGYTEVTIGGQSFDRLDLIVKVPDGSGLVAHQRYFATRHGDDMICFIQTYVDEADLPTLDAILASIKLDWK
jgi:hypothetical protein